MNLPEEAIDASMEAILEPGNPSNKYIREISHYRQQMQAALEAALPEIEAALRTQIAADISIPYSNPWLVYAPGHYSHSRRGEHPTWAEAINHAQKQARKDNQ